MDRWNDKVNLGSLRNFQLKMVKLDFSWKQFILCLRYTPSIPNYKSFDFFNFKFDHSSYSKNLCKRVVDLFVGRQYRRRSKQGLSPGRG